MKTTASTDRRSTAPARHSPDRAASGPSDRPGSAEEPPAADRPADAPDARLAVTDFLHRWNSTGRRTPVEPPPFVEFKPHPLLRSGHLQTVAGAYAPLPPHDYRAEPRLVELGDGERLVLHDDRPDEWRPGDRAVLLLHGLGGCHRSPYMIRFAQKLNARGVRVFRMDMRGHGAGLTLAGSPGHAGRSEDAAAAVDCIAQLCPGSPIGLAGISLGGNILLKLAGEAAERMHRQVDRILAVSPPVDLVACSKLIRRFRSRLYDRAFVRELMQQVVERRPHWPALERIDLSRRPRTLWEFDDRVTAPLSGFRDAGHYYETASAGPLLKSIAVPTLIVTAADDPLVPPQLFAVAETSEFVSIRITEHGGHLGYIGAKGVDPDRRWLDWRVVEWALAPPAALDPLATVDQRSTPSTGPVA